MNMTGYSGSIVLNDTTVIDQVATGGKAIRAIDPLTNCTFTTLTDKTATTNGGVTPSVGADYGTITKPIYGTFSVVTLATGSAILYY